MDKTETIDCTFCDNFLLCNKRPNIEYLATCDKFKDTFDGLYDDDDDMNETDITLNLGDGEVDLYVCSNSLYGERCCKGCVAGIPHELNNIIDREEICEDSGKRVCGIIYKKN